MDAVHCSLNFTLVYRRSYNSDLGSIMERTFQLLMQCSPFLQPYANLHPILIFVALTQNSTNQIFDRR